MKLLIISLIFTYVSTAQKNIEINELIAAKKNIIAFQCGGGPTAGLAVKFTELIKTQDYTKIKELLSSNNPAEKFFAAVSCTKLVDFKKIDLSGEEKKIISEIYNSNDIVYSCWGCTYRRAKPIREYINDKNDVLLITTIESMIEELLK